MKPRQLTADDLRQLAGYPKPDIWIEILESCFDQTPRREAAVIKLEQLRDKSRECARTDPERSFWTQYQLFLDKQSLANEAKFAVKAFLDVSRPSRIDRFLESPWAQALAGLGNPVAGVVMTLGGGLLSSREHAEQSMAMQVLREEVAMLQRQTEQLRARLRAAEKLRAGQAPGVERVVTEFVDRPVAVPFVVAHVAEGGFAVQVVSKHRQARAQARGWSARLRALDTERARRLADPAAGQGPGTDSWQALLADISHARTGLSNAMADLWGPTAAKAAVAESEARALPLTMAAARQLPRPSSSPPPAGIAPRPPAVLEPSPEPSAAMVNGELLLDAYEEGLLSALRGSR